MLLSKGLLVDGREPLGFLDLDGGRASGPLVFMGFLDGGRGSGPLMLLVFRDGGRGSGLLVFLRFRDGGRGSGQILSFGFLDGRGGRLLSQDFLDGGGDLEGMVDGMEAAFIEVFCFVSRGISSGQVVQKWN